MKLNPKVYNQLKGTPFMSQNIDGVLVEFFYMDDTPYLYQYAGKGRFAIWTSNGINYRVLVEKTYYEAIEAFYEEPVNRIWVNFLDRIGKITKKINMLFIIPIIIFYLGIAVLATLFFQDYMLTILLVLIVMVVISNMIQGQIVNKRVRKENQAAQDEIRRYLGEEGFSDMVQKQEEHYKAYFKFEDEVAGEPVDSIDLEQEDEHEESESDIDDK
ncbi:MAG: hypothetical protein WCR73_00365 [Acholeplasmataceae bacterium]